MKFSLLVLLFVVNACQTAIGCHHCRGRPRCGRPHGRFPQGESVSTDKEAVDFENENVAEHAEMKLELEACAAKRIERGLSRPGPRKTDLFLLGSLLSEAILQIDAYCSEETVLCNALKDCAVEQYGKNEVVLIKNLQPEKKLFLQELQSPNLQ